MKLKTHREQQKNRKLIQTLDNRINYYKNLNDVDQESINQMIQLLEYYKTAFSFPKGVLVPTPSNRKEIIDPETGEVKQGTIKNNPKQALKSLIILNHIQEKFLNNGTMMSSQINKIPKFNGVNPYNYIKYNSVDKARTNKEFKVDATIQAVLVSALHNMRNFVTPDEVKEKIEVVEEDNWWEVSEEETQNIILENSSTSAKPVIDMKIVMDSLAKKKEQLGEEFLANSGSMVTFDELEKLNEIILMISEHRLLSKDRNLIDKILFTKKLSVNKKIEKIHNIVTTCNLQSFEQNKSYAFGEIEEIKKGYCFTKKEDKTKKWDTSGNTYIKYTTEKSEISEFYFDEHAHKKISDSFYKFSSEIKDLVPDYLEIINKWSTKVKDNSLNSFEVKYDSVIENSKNKFIFNYIREQKNSETEYNVVYSRFVNKIDFKSYKKQELLLNESKNIRTFHNTGSNSKKDIKEDKGRIFNVFTDISKDFRILTLKGFHEFDIDNGMSTYFRKLLSDNGKSNKQHDLFFHNKNEIRKLLREKFNGFVMLYDSKTKSEIKTIIASTYYGNVINPFGFIQDFKLSSGETFSVKEFLEEVETGRKLLNAPAYQPKKNKLTENNKEQNPVYVGYTAWEKEQIEKFIENNNLKGSNEVVRVHDAIYTPKKCTWFGDDEVKFGFSSWSDMYQELETKAKVYFDIFIPLTEIGQMITEDLRVANSVLSRKKLSDVSKEKWTKEKMMRIKPLAKFCDKNEGFDFEFKKFYENHLENIERDSDFKYSALESIVSDIELKLKLFEDVSYKVNNFEEFSSEWETREIKNNKFVQKVQELIVDLLIYEYSYPSDKVWRIHSGLFNYFLNRILKVYRYKSS